LLAGTVIAATMPAPVQAQAAGAAVLLRQARYWEGRGRRDLALQAYRRLLAIDPSNAAARRGVAGPTEAAPAPSRPQTPTSAPAPAPRQAATRTPAPAPAPRATPAPAPSRGNTDGASRAAGFEALDSGNLERAESQFRAALRRRSNDADALGGLGLVELRRERFAEARDLLQRASRGGNRGRWAEALGSASFFADLRRAEADLAAGRVAEAQETAERLARSDSPQARNAFPLLAQSYERQGRYNDAAALYTQAARAGSGSETSTLRVSAIRAEAQAAVNSGNVGQAQQLYDRALSLQPNDPWLRYDYARFLRDQRRPMDANTVIGPLTQTALPEALYAAALYAQQGGQVAQAEGLIARIPEASRTPEINGFVLGLRAEQAVARARALGAQGQQAAALQSLRQIADMPGLPAEQLAQLSAIMLELGDAPTGAMLAQRAAEMPMARADGYDPIIRVLATTGQDMAADNALARATQLAGASAGGAQTVAGLRATLAAGRADRLRLSGQYAAAFDVLQQAWAGGPGDPQILAALARLYQAGNLDAQAAQTYRMILAKDPNDREALVGFAETAASAGEHGAARDAVKHAIRAAPADYRPYLAAARIEQARGDEGAARKYLSEARERYMAQNGGGAGNPFGGNPFAQMQTAQSLQATNPFAPVAAGNNPFALGNSAGGNQVASLAPVSPFAPAPFAPTPFASASVRSDGYAQPFPTGGAPGPVQGWPSTTPGGAPAAGDPVLAGIEADMRRLTASSAPRADITTGYRERSGETGLSALKEVSATAKLSTGALGGRIGVQAQAVTLDSGRPTGSALARFGRNGTEEAQAIADERPALLAAADTQSDAGVAIAATYESDLVKADVGVTPIGFRKRHPTGGASLTPRFSPQTSGRLWAEHRPVTDSVVSYAGSVDPVSGQFWGSVMRSGGGASLSWDDQGNGAYLDGAWHRYKGTGVRKNSSLQFNAGGYTRAYGDSGSSLTLGINANYQRYANNQNYFSYGHGGYFSPQSFFSVSFPVRFAMDSGRWDVDANVAPGYQSYSQDEAALFPTDPGAQAVLDRLKTANSDVRAQYDSLSETGFGLAGGASVYYGVSGNTRIGGDVNVNTFGQYNEVRTSIGIKQTLGTGK
jgi:tetratricopeptide (TPR) repeat protein